MNLIFFFSFQKAATALREGKVGPDHIFRSLLYTMIILAFEGILSRFLNPYSLRIEALAGTIISFIIAIAALLYLFHSFPVGHKEKFINNYLVLLLPFTVITFLVYFANAIFAFGFWIMFNDVYSHNYLSFYIGDTLFFYSIYLGLLLRMKRALAESVDADGRI